MRWGHHGRVAVQQLAAAGAQPVRRIGKTGKSRVSPGALRWTVRSPTVVHPNRPWQCLYLFPIHTGTAHCARYSARSPDRSDPPHRPHRLLPDRHGARPLHRHLRLAGERRHRLRMQLHHLHRRRRAPVPAPVRPGPAWRSRAPSVRSNIALNSAKASLLYSFSGSRWP